MLIVSIAVVCCALIVIFLASRGRVVQRGVFCRRCRFDLAGIDLEPSEARCPECGSAVYQHEARRITQRRAARGWLAVGVLLLLLGASGMYISLFVTSGTLYQYLPSQIVLSIAERGTNEAIDEAIKRWSTPGELTPEQQERLIQHALEVQADHEQTWDPRWGELLRYTIESKMLSDEQLIAFAINGYTHQAVLPDEIRQGEDEIAYTMKTSGDRVMSTWGGVMPYQHGAWITSWGVEDESPIGEFSSPQRVRPMVLQGPEPSDDWVRSKFRGASAFSDSPAGSEVLIYVEYRIRLMDPDRAEPIMDRTIRQQHCIKIVGDESPIVAATRRAGLAAQLIDAIGITPLYTVERPNSGDSGYQLILAQTTLRANPLPVPIAMRVYLLFGDEEIEIDRYSMKTHPTSGYAEVISWRISPTEPHAVTEAMPYHTKLIEQECVDVLMRPDPEFARENPEIKEIADVTLIFRDVPLRLETATNWMNQPRLEEAVIKGEVLIEPGQEAQTEEAP